ncbi:MAG: T9SS type A sorting domain-containing protein, partial [Candidatus Eisenbacteria bacterium]|nr:T9SS type A sorting domain-containing protein [Candidatus Eisenbacteria bacterium]
ESVSFFESDAPNNRDTLLGRVIDWFGPDTGADASVIHRLAVEGVFPNPFNPLTKIAYTVPEDAGRVRLTLHNVCGQLVRTLVDGELPAGPSTAVWDGTDDNGRSLATGVYFARLSAGDQKAVAKMTLLK